MSVVAEVTTSLKSHPVSLTHSKLDICVANASIRRDGLARMTSSIDSALQNSRDP